MPQICDYVVFKDLKMEHLKLQIIQVHCIRKGCFIFFHNRLHILCASPFTLLSTFCFADFVNQDRKTSMLHMEIVRDCRSVLFRGTLTI